jgi:hypothetical protein
MTDWQYHEARSRELADSIRRYLVAAHTGGIATTFALAGSLAGDHVHPRWAFAPVAVFATGLVFAGISMLLAQDREIQRRDAKRAGEPDPEFSVLRWSWAWNWASLGLFVAAIFIGLVCLGSVTVTS